MQAGAGNPNRGRVLIPAGMNEARRGFCRPGTNFLRYTSVGVQGCLMDGNLSRYCYFFNSTGAVRIYYQLLSCLESREQNAKTMTSLLIIPSVLGFRSIFISLSWQEFFFFCLGYSNLILCICLETSKLSTIIKTL